MTGGLDLRRALLGALLLVLTAAFAPAAEAAFTAPFYLSDAGQGNAFQQQVASDADGDSLVVWVSYDATTSCDGAHCARILARPRSAVGVLGSIQTLSPAGQHAGYPQVAIDADGDALVVWERHDGTTDCGGGWCTRIQGRARSAAGTLSATQSLSAPGQHASQPEVAIDADGDAVVVWSRPDGTTGCGGASCYRIQARARSSTGTLSTTQTLSAAGQHTYYNPPQVAIDADGDALVVWTRPDGTTGCEGAGFGCVRSQARARSSTGTLGTTQTLSAPGQHAYQPEVAIDTDGDALVVWLRYDGTTACGGFSCNLVQARARSAAGALNPVQTLSGPGQNANSPQVAIDTVGDAVAVWARFDGTSNRIQIRARSAAGALAAVQSLNAAGTGGELPQVAIDADGDAVVVWKQSFKILARTRSAAGAIGTLQTLSSAYDVEVPQVAVDATGDALAVWSRWDPSVVDERIAASAGP